MAEHPLASSKMIGETPSLFTTARNIGTGMSARIGSTRVQERAMVIAMSSTCGASLTARGLECMRS
jgi:hypothetical protein